jgi:spoIIIJ-associated protein
MEWVVTTGRTVEEAKDAALDELGVDEHDAEFEVLEQPRQGLFGRQRGEARVRARVRPSVPRPKTDRRDRRRRRAEGPNARSSGGGAAGSEDAGALDRDEDAGDDRPAGPPADRDAGAVASSAPVAAVAAVASGRSPGTSGDVDGDGDGAPAVGVGPSEPGPGAGRSRRRRRRRSSGAGRSEAEATGRDSFADGGTADDDDDADDELLNGGTDVGEQELDLAQQGEIAETFVEGLLEKFELTAQTTTTTLDDDTLEVTVTGEDLGLLIGPKGQTLQAMQELTRTVVQRRASNRVGRILVDVAGYRVRRREALERFTRQVAEDVRTSGVQRVLEPMSAADRKIVHDTANELEGVRTISEGEEPRRRVVILPATDAEADAG